MQGHHEPIIDEMNLSQDESGIIISWFVRVGLLLAVLGVVVFDIGSIIVNQVTLSSSAEDIAIAVSITISDQNTGGRIIPASVVYDMAVEEVEDEANGIKGAKVLRKGTEIDAEGNVHIRLRRRAETLVADLISPLEKYTISTGDGQAGTN